MYQPVLCCSDCRGAVPAMRYRTRDTEEESDSYHAYGMWYQVLGGSTCSPRGILPIQKKGKESKESDRYRDYGTWYQVPEGSTYSPCGISPIKKIERDESIKVSCSNKIPYSYPLKKKWHTPLATTWGGQFWLNLNLNSSCIPSTTKQNHILALSASTTRSKPAPMRRVIFRWESVCWRCQTTQFSVVV